MADKQQKPKEQTYNRFVGTADDLNFDPNWQPPSYDGEKTETPKKEQKMKPPAQLSKEELMQLADMLKPFLSKPQPDEMKAAAKEDAMPMEDGEEDMSLELEIEKEDDSEDMQDGEDMQDQEDKSCGKYGKKA